MQVLAKGFSLFWIFDHAVIGALLLASLIRLGNLMNSGDMSQNVELLPGDVLIVPQSMF